MTKLEKLLARMRNNPRDWSIEDMKAWLRGMGSIGVNRSRAMSRSAIQGSCL
jgi:hypothetical protein